MSNDKDPFQPDPTQVKDHAEKEYEIINRQLRRRVKELEELTGGLSSDILDLKKKLNPNKDSE